MSLYVRKIEAAKWRQNKIIEGEDVSADAITRSLRTTNNCLSAWHISEKSQILDAVLAIVSWHDKLDTIDVVVLPSTGLTEAGLSVQISPGQTALKDLAESHYDIVELTYKTLGSLAGLIVKEFKNDGVMRYTRVQLLKLVKDAVQSGRIELSDLKDGVRKEMC